MADSVRSVVDRRTVPRHDAGSLVGRLPQGTTGHSSRTTNYPRFFPPCSTCFALASVEARAGFWRRSARAKERSLSAGGRQRWSALPRSSPHREDSPASTVPKERQSSADLLLCFCLENAKHSQGRDQQVQRIGPAHYLASWVDLPQQVSHLRHIPEMIVATLADQDGEHVKVNDEGDKTWFAVGRGYEDNVLLRAFSQGGLSAGRCIGRSFIGSVQRRRRHRRVGSTGGHSARGRDRNSAAGHAGSAGVPNLQSAILDRARCAEFLRRHPTFPARLFDGSAAPRAGGHAGVLYFGRHDDDSIEPGRDATRLGGTGARAGTFGTEIDGSARGLLEWRRSPHPRLRGSSLWTISCGVWNAFPMY